MSFYNELDCSIFDSVESRFTDFSIPGFLPCYDENSSESPTTECLEFPTYDPCSDPDSKLTSDTAISSQLSDLSSSYQRPEDYSYCAAEKTEYETNSNPEPHLNIESDLLHIPARTQYIAAVRSSEQINPTLVDEHRLLETQLEKPSIDAHPVKTPANFPPSTLDLDVPLFRYVTAEPKGFDLRLVQENEGSLRPLGRDDYAVTTGRAEYEKHFCSPIAVNGQIDPSSPATQECKAPDFSANEIGSCVPSSVQTWPVDEVGSVSVSKSQLPADIEGDGWQTEAGQYHTSDTFPAVWNQSEGCGMHNVKWMSDLFATVFREFEGEKEVCRPAVTSHTRVSRIGAIGTKSQSTNNNMLCIFVQEGNEHRLTNKPLFLTPVLKEFSFFTDMIWADHRNLIVAHGMGCRTSIELISFDQFDFSRPLCVKLPSIHTNEIREMDISQGRLASVGYDGMVCLMDISATKTRILRDLVPIREKKIQEFDQVIGSIRWHPTDVNQMGITWDDGCWCLLDVRQGNPIQNVQFQEMIFTNEFIDEYVVALGGSNGKLHFCDIRGTQQVFKVVKDPCNQIIADIRFQPRSRLLASIGVPDTSLLSVSPGYELEAHPVTHLNGDYTIGTFASPCELLVATNRGRLCSQRVCSDQ